VTGKNRAIPGLHRDSFPGLTGQVQGRLLRQVTFTKLYCRAVSKHYSPIQLNTMTKVQFFIAILIFSTSCHPLAKPKIERFVWIQNNLNWIWQPSDLQARNYLEYVDSTNMINFAYSLIIREDDKLKRERTDYFVAPAPDSLKQMIYNYLFDRKYAQYYKDQQNSGMVYDGDYYCIIYKFQNHPEQIINYLPHTILDSLKHFTDYISNLKNLKTFKTQKSFDINYLIDKYRLLIVDDNHLAPPPPPASNRIIYRYDKK
jgi:hypothetical protein